VKLKQLTKTKPLLIASLILTLAAIGMTYQAVQAGMLEAFDYNCYTQLDIEVAIPSTIDTFTLIDQFGETEHTVQGPAEVFCAAANKNVVGGGQFVFPEEFGLGAHFTSYQIEGPAPEIAGVILTDQFVPGGAEHVVGPAVEVFIPALKFTGPELSTVNVHWKCYEIDGETIPVQLTMTDQFGPHNYQGLTPSLLCNPATKIVGEVELPPAEEFLDLHLKCYTTEGGATGGIGKVFLDQFFVLTAINAATEAGICVEAEKTIVDFTVEKTWTKTDYNWDPICDDLDDETLNEDPETGECLVGFRAANINFNGENTDPDDDVLADSLDPPTVDGISDVVVHVKKNGAISNMNPGAIYALTTVVLTGDFDMLEVEERYDDCTDVELELLNQNKKSRNVKVAVADSNGDVTEITDRLYDELDLDVVFVGPVTETSTTVKINDESLLTDGSTVFVLVKFDDQLKGVDGDILPLLCDNIEWVTATIGELDIEKHAEATLRFTEA